MNFDDVETSLEHGANPIDHVVSNRVISLVERWATPTLGLPLGYLSKKPLDLTRPGFLCWVGDGRTEHQF